jgi:endonuclease YncB( thermonuclease family)
MPFFKMSWFNMSCFNSNFKNKYVKPIKVSSKDCIFDYYDCEDITIKWEDTVSFTVPIKGGKVIKVYDGDSITIAAKLPFDDAVIYRFSVRLNGIDTPEIKGKTDDEKEAAKHARDALSQLILNKNITLKNVNNEKYGRILADVYLDDIHINEWLIKERFAVRYNGGTKNTPESWLQYKNNI